MAESRAARPQATSSTVSWNTDEAYKYIMQVCGHAEKIPELYDHTTGTEEMLRQLKVQYDGKHGMRCFGLLR